MEDKNLQNEQLIAEGAIPINYTFTGLSKENGLNEYEALPMSATIGEETSITFVVKENCAIKGLEVTPGADQIESLVISKNKITFTLQAEHAVKSVNISIYIEAKKVFKFQSTPIEMQIKPEKINAVFYVGDGVEDMDAYISNNALDKVPDWEKITSPNFTFQAFKNNKKEEDKNWGVAVAIGLIE